jgi:nicotinamide-nucleotide amidase
MPTAEIITIGTELLLGETLDTNTRFIAHTLLNLGMDLFRTQTVGDNTARIASAVCEAAGRADLVITTGGLGPTIDDPTRQAISDAFNAPLEFHPELWEEITARISRYGRTPTENQKRQAFIPKGAIVINNPVGTAPAFILESLPSLSIDADASGHGNKVVISLPGVPREMETLLLDSVIPYLQHHYHLDKIILVHTLHTSGIGEGMVDERIGDLEKLSNPTVGLTAHSGIVDIRIAAKARSEKDAQKMITELEMEITSRMKEAIFGADDVTLEEAVLNIFSQKGWTLSCLESGLEGALLSHFARTRHAAWQDGIRKEIPVDRLPDETDAFRQSTKATIGLGVHLDQCQEDWVVSIVMLLPSGMRTRKLNYAGHPRNAPRWAANMALDQLRRSVQEIQ